MIIETCVQTSSKRWKKKENFKYDEAEDMHIATYIYACSLCNIGDKSYIIICLHFMSGSEPKHQTVGKSVTLNIVEYKQNLNYSSCVLLGWAWPMLCYNK